MKIRLTQMQNHPNPGSPRKTLGIALLVALCVGMPSSAMDGFGEFSAPKAEQPAKKAPAVKSKPQSTSNKKSRPSAAARQAAQPRKLQPPAVEIESKRSGCITEDALGKTATFYTYDCATSYQYIGPLPNRLPINGPTW